MEIKSIVGKLVTLRLATVYDRGVVVAEENGRIELRDAVFVAETGDFTKYSRTGKGQTEWPIDGRVIVYVGAICDIIVHD
jgi:hypothetical protein